MNCMNKEINPAYNKNMYSNITFVEFRVADRVVVWGSHRQYIKVV